jgi:hypothetical protein
MFIIYNTRMRHWEEEPINNMQANIHFLMVQKTSFTEIYLFVIN